MAKGAVYYKQKGPFGVHWMLSSVRHYSSLFKKKQKHFNIDKKYIVPEVQVVLRGLQQTFHHSQPQILNSPEAIALDYLILPLVVSSITLNHMLNTTDFSILGILYQFPIIQR